MQQRLHPYLTTGIAVVTAGLVAVVPATAPPAPDAGQQLAHPWIALTSGPAGLDADLATGAAAAAAQPLSIPLLTLNVGQIVDTLGFGSKTISDLVDQAGFSDTTVAALAIQLLDALGVGNPTISGLLDQVGVGNESVAALLIQILGFAGVDNPTISGLLDQAGLGDQSLAALAITVLDAAGIHDPTISDLLDNVGVGDQSLASVATLLLDLTGIGNPSVLGLIENLGLVSPDLTLGGALTELVNSLFGTSITVTGLVEKLGGGDITLGSLITMGLDAVKVGGQPVGEQTPVDLLNQFWYPAPPPGTEPTGPPIGGLSLEQLVISVLQTNNLDQTPAQLIASDPTLANTTVGELLAQVAPTDNAPPGQYTSLADEPMTTFLASSMAGGVGLQTLKQLASPPPSGIECTFLPVIAPGISCGSTLNSLLGPRTVGETLENLKSNSTSVDPNVPVGTPASDLTVANLVNGTGSFATMPISQLLTGLNLHTPTVATFLSGFGFDDKNIDTLLHDAFPGVYNTTIGTLLGDWGLSNLPVDQVINGLGLDVPVVTLLGRLGLDSLSLDSVLNSLLGHITVGSIADSLGLNSVHLNSVLTTLLGGVTVDKIASDLGLDKIDLNTFLDNLLGNVSVNTIAGNLGLDNVHLDAVLNSMFSDMTLGKIVDNLGIGNTDINAMLSSLGLLDKDVLTVSLEFKGLLPSIVVGLPDHTDTAAAAGTGFWPDLAAEFNASIAQLWAHF